MINKKITLLTLMMLGLCQSTQGFTGICESIKSFLGYSCVPENQFFGLYQFEPKITFDDVAGLAQAKEDLSVILRYIENRAQWERSGIHLNRLFILSGASRSGRSFITAALSGEIKKILKKQNRNLDEFKILGIEHLGMEMIGIPKFVARIKAQAPCILFIDDARITPGTPRGDFFERLVTALDDSTKPVIILAATRDPLDKDFQRGKFGTVIDFEFPDFADRKEFINQTLNKFTADFANKESMVAQLAAITDGASYNELKDFICIAFQKSKIRSVPLNQELLEETISQEMAQHHIRTLQK